jgi:NAD(P)-dependent dehydrogenase (short-subunit alcohol dehydrogenase family)
VGISGSASSGIGAATARKLALRGFHLLAGVRRDRGADAIRRPAIEPLIVDISNPDHIRALATRVHGHLSPGQCGRS